MVGSLWCLVSFCVELYWSWHISHVCVCLLPEILCGFSTTANTRRDGSSQTVLFHHLRSWYCLPHPHSLYHFTTLSASRVCVRTDMEIKRKRKEREQVKWKKKYRVLSKMSEVYSPSNAVITAGNVILLEMCSNICIVILRWSHMCVICEGWLRPRGVEQETMTPGFSFLSEERAAFVEGLTFCLSVSLEFVFKSLFCSVLQSTSSLKQTSALSTLPLFLSRS